MSDKRAGTPSKVTPARRVGEAKPVPLGNLATADNHAQKRERRMDPQSREAFEKGLQTGLAKGRKEGFEAARAQLEQEQRETALEAGGFAAQRIESAVASLNSELAALEDMLAKQVVDLAVSLARQVVMGELTQHPEQIRHVVGECLAMLPEETGKVSVRLNPADLNWIEQAIQARQLPPIDFLAVDDDIRPGGCTVEYAGGDIDATLATRWHRTLASIGKEAVDDSDA